MGRLHFGVLGLLLVLVGCGSNTDAPSGSGGASASTGGAGVSAGAPAGSGSSGKASVAGSSNSAGALGGGAAGASDPGTPGAGGASDTAGASSGAGGAGTAGAGTAGAGGAVVVPPAGTDWDRPSTGNPFLPGYFADPSVFYDSTSSTFYVYATTDGDWIDYSSEPSVWYSKDFVEVELELSRCVGADRITHRTTLMR